MPTEAALTEDAPIVKLVDTIFADAMRAGASDVHVEPQAKALRIRYRVDGLLRDVMEIPRSAAASITSRIKIISGLDASQLEALLTTLETPQGLVLITGPTGSGKTNTLYAAIKEINTPEPKVR